MLNNIYMYIYIMKYIHGTAKGVRKLNLKTYSRYNMGRAIDSKIIDRNGRI